MRKISFAFLGAAVAAAAMTACASPTAATVPACQTNNTASLTLANTSKGTAQRIVLNGATIATLGPGTSSSAQTIAAGVPYALQFFVANSSSLACSDSVVTLAQCTTDTRSCAFP